MTGLVQNNKPTEHRLLQIKLWAGDVFLCCLNPPVITIDPKGLTESVSSNGFNEQVGVRSSLL